MEVTVREWVDGDEKEALTVMRQGASTNFWSACRVTWSKNLFIICVFTLNAILYQISGEHILMNSKTMMCMINKLYFHCQVLSVL